MEKRTGRVELWVSWGWDVESEERKRFGNLRSGGGLEVLGCKEVCGWLSGDIFINFFKEGANE